MAHNEGGPLTLAMRPLTALILSLGISMASMQAPFTHVHAAGEAEEHIAREHAGSLAFHIHLGQGRHGASLDQLGPSSRLTNWYRFEIETPFSGTARPVVTGLLAAAPAPTVKRFYLVESLDRLHDPPQTQPPSLRGPPSC